MKFVKSFIDDFFNIFIKRIYTCDFKYVLFLIKFEKNAHLFFLRDVDEFFFLLKFGKFFDNELNYRVFFVNRDLVQYYDVYFRKNYRDFRNRYFGK